jgi:putative membrane protein
MKILLKIIINALVILALARFVPGIGVSSFYVALIVALVLGIINIFIRPILVILTLPISLITLGLFTFVINAFLFWFVSTFVKGFTVSGFWPAFLGALILSLVSSLVSHLI